MLLLLLDKQTSDCLPEMRHHCYRCTNFACLLSTLFLIYSWAWSGPDICGPGTKKVHVIFNYKGKNHLINKDIRCKVRHVFTFKQEKVKAVSNNKLP